MFFTWLLYKERTTVTATAAGQLEIERHVARGVVDCCGLQIVLPAFIVEIKAKTQNSG